MAGITLAQLAQAENDAPKKFLQMSILRDSQVMGMVPFENVSSLRVNAQFWETLPTGGAWRSLNEGYTSAEDGQLGDAWESLYFFGGDITFDRAIQAVKDTIKDPVQLQIEGKTKAMTLQWNDYFINGDSGTDPKGFNGLKKRVAGMPSRQTVYWAASNAAPLDPTASAANARSFLNRLRKGWRYCNAGKVSAVLCNEDFIIGISAALIYAQAQGNYLDVTKDQFEREITTYRGVPLVDMGYKNDLTTEILTTTEVAGDAGTDSISQYLVSFNTEEGVHGIQLNQMNFYDPLNGGEMESKPAKMRRLDWYNGIASFGTRGIVRMRNLSNLAGFTEN